MHTRKWVHTHKEKNLTQLALNFLLKPEASLRKSMHIVGMDTFDLWCKEFWTWSMTSVLRINKAAGTCPAQGLMRENSSQVPTVRFIVTSCKQPSSLLAGWLWVSVLTHLSCCQKALNLETAMPAMTWGIVSVHWNLLHVTEVWDDLSAILFKPRTMVLVFLLKLNKLACRTWDSLRITKVFSSLYQLYGN